jgi:hypothetical protein
MLNKKRIACKVTGALLKPVVDVEINNTSSYLTIRTQNKILT